MQLFSSKKAGNTGESYTVRYLKKKGCKILERNFSCKTGEIDIIAADREYILFVEVKTRRSGSVILPCEAVDRGKQNKLLKTAAFYLQNHPSALQPRFDIAEVYICPERYKLKHIHYIEHAFMQEGDYASF